MLWPMLVLRSFLWANNVSLYGYGYKHSVICPSGGEEYLCRFLFMALMSDAVLNMCVQAFV